MDDRTPLSLDILWFLANAPEPATLAEIVTGTGHSRTTVDRTLGRLCESGWVSQTGRPKRFTASIRVALMGTVMLRQNRVRELAVRYARELAQTVQNSVGMGFYDNGDVIFTDLVDLRGVHFIHELPAASIPALRTASGKILLAYQPDAEIERVVRRSLAQTMPLGCADPDAITAELHACREQGYALSAYYEQQTAGLAVPVLDQPGRAAVALGLPLLLPVDEATVSRLVPVARMMALRASAELQNHPSRGHLVS